MANECMFIMKVTGKVKGIRRVVNAAVAAYEDTPEDPEHFWRVHDFYLITPSKLNDEIHSFEFGGACAWSVWSCMFDGPSTYQSQNPNSSGITLQQISKEEHLVIEVYSQEPGLCFSEHFLIVFGEIIINDEADYYEFSSEVTPEELLEHSGLHWTQTQIDDYFKKEDTLIICKHNWNFNNHEEIYYDTTRNN